MARQQGREEKKKKKKRLVFVVVGLVSLSSDSARGLNAPVRVTGESDLFTPGFYGHAPKRLFHCLSPAKGEGWGGVGWGGDTLLVPCRTTRDFFLFSLPLGRVFITAAGHFASVPVYRRWDLSLAVLSSSSHRTGFASHCRLRPTNTVDPSTRPTGGFGS